MYFLIACLFNILGFLMIDAYTNIEFGSIEYLAIVIVALSFNIAGKFNDKFIND